MRGYLEIACCERFSVFGEVPVRWVHGLGNDARGAGDINGGLRFGLFADDYSFLTVQVRAYAQTGDAEDGLGTGHSAIEGGLLFQTKLSPRATVFGEILDWQATDGFRVADFGFITNAADFEGQRFNGNVLRYGVGLGYDVWQSAERCNYSRITGVFEAVGWSVLDGLKTNAPGTETFDASSDTIINGKYGVRYTTPSGRMQLYAGYGHAWTDELWYNSIFRVELLYNF